MQLILKAIQQGHVYAMHFLGTTLDQKKEHEKAVEWYTKVGWCRLPVSNPR